MWHCLHSNSDSVKAGPVCAGKGNQDWSLVHFFSIQKAAHHELKRCSGGMCPTRREQQERNMSSAINLFLMEMASVLNVHMAPDPSHMSHAGDKNEGLPVFKRKNKTLFCIIYA